MSRNHKQDRSGPPPAGEMREALRLAAAGRAAVARNLARLYDEVLEAPLPRELCALLRRLEERDTQER